MNPFVFSEDRLAAALGQSRKVFSALRRKKVAAGLFVATNGEIFYSREGVSALLAALEAGPVVDFDALLEKTRAVAPSAQPATMEKPAPSAPPLFLQVRVLRQYPNNRFWRCMDIESSVVLDLYEPKKPWLLGVRKVVRVVPVDGKPYYKLAPKTA